ncbi:MAG: TolC family protein [Gammaproteobacteria bacterium]|nr:TolC family protein [Gammaproteobacteria bacterium]
MAKEKHQRQTLSRICTYALLSLPLFSLSGCIEYHPKPLDPLLINQHLSQRSLEIQGLKIFLEQQGQTLHTWPLKQWNLNQLTLAGLYFHPELKISQAAWQQAQAKQQQAAQRVNPQLSITPTFNASNDLPSPWILSSLLNFSFESAGKRQIRQQQAEQLSESARLTLANSAWQIHSRIRQQLEQLWFSKQQQRLLSQQQQLQRESLHRVEQQYAAGNLSALELVRVRLAPEQSQLALLDIKRQYADRLIQLASALGLYPEALHQIQFDFSELNQSLTKSDLKQLRQRALSNHAQLLLRLADYRSSEANLQLAIAQQYPDIQLGPGYEYDQGSNKWSLGLGITLPFFHNQEPQIAAAESQRRAAAARFEAQQLKVVQGVAQALSGYAAAKVKKQTADLIQKDVEQQLKRAQARLQAGVLSAADLIAVHLQNTSAKLAQLNAQAALQQAKGALEDASQRPIKANHALWQHTLSYSVPNDNGGR